MTMRASKKRKLEAKGWKVGNADEFLGLSPEESAYIVYQEDEKTEPGGLNGESVCWRAGGRSPSALHRIHGEPFGKQPLNAA
jgi:hypothetical protein